MTTQGATPRPWRVIASTDLTEIAAGVHSNPTDNVPVVAWPGFDDSFRPRTQHNANARLIVEAVNAHDRLQAEHDETTRLLHEIEHGNYASIDKAAERVKEARGE